MKKNKIKNVVQFKSCSNADIAEAVLSLAKPVLASCGNDEAMQKSIISLAVHGWNLSLFQESEDEYIEKINKRMGDSLSDEQKAVFVTFVLQIIQTKQSEFNDYMKGITKHTISFENDSPSLTVETLPVNPKQV